MSNKDFNMRAYIDIINESNEIEEHATGERHLEPRVYTDGVEQPPVYTDADGKTFIPTERQKAWGDDLTPADLDKLPRLKKAMADWDLKHAPDAGQMPHRK
jgi:hypothetical protein